MFMCLLSQSGRAMIFLQFLACLEYLIFGFRPQVLKYMGPDALRKVIESAKPYQQCVSETDKVV